MRHMELSRLCATYMTRDKLLFSNCPVCNNVCVRPTSLSWPRVVHYSIVRKFYPNEFHSIKPRCAALPWFFVLFCCFSKSCTKSSGTRRECAVVLAFVSRVAEMSWHRNVPGVIFSYGSRTAFARLTYAMGVLADAERSCEKLKTKHYRPCTRAPPWTSSQRRGHDRRRRRGQDLPPRIVCDYIRITRVISLSLFLLSRRLPSACESASSAETHRSRVRFRDRPRVGYP